MQTWGKFRISVKSSYIIQTQKTAFKKIIPILVFPVYPPGKIEQKFMEDRFQKISVAWYIMESLFTSVNTPGGPCMHRWIYIAECPFVCRQLTIWMHIPFAG